MLPSYLGYLGIYIQMDYNNAAQGAANLSAIKVGGWKRVRHFGLDATFSCTRSPQKVPGEQFFLDPKLSELKDSQSLQ